MDFTVSALLTRRRALVGEGTGAFGNRRRPNTPSRPPPIGFTTNLKQPFEEKVSKTIVNGERSVHRRHDANSRPSLTDSTTTPSTNGLMLFITTTVSIHEPKLKGTSVYKYGSFLINYSYYSLWLMNLLFEKGRRLHFQKCTIISYFFN